MSDVAPVKRLIRRVARRLRAQRALEAISSMLILSGAWLILAVFLLKIRHLDPDRLPEILGVALLFPVGGLVVSILRPVRPLVAAQIVDRRLGLKDRMGSAWDFATRAEAGAALGPYAGMEVEDAARRAETVKASAALPLRLPRRLAVFAAQLAVVTLLILLPAFPEPAPAEAAAPPPDVQGMAVDFDELAGYNEFLRDVHQDAVDEELDQVAAAAEEFNALLQDLADQRLPYLDALERIAALEQKLADERWEPDPEAERFLEQVGRDLSASKMTKEAGEALRENDLREARDKVREAAQKVEREPPDRQRLEELRRALEAAAKRQPPQSDQLQSQRDPQRRLKQKGQDQGPQDAQKQRRLKKNDRELERLQRNLEKQRERRRELERLQRDLERAAASLNLDASSSELQQMLEQMAEDINRMAREQSTEEQMEQLRQRLEELRRLLRQMQRGGKSFKLRLGQFNKGAQGQCQGGGGQGGDGDGNGKTITLMPGGGSKGGLLQLGAKGSSLGLKQGGGGQKGQQQPGGGQGQGIGTEHDPNTMGDPTQIKARPVDVEVSLQHGEGPSRSQVIETAADQGFASPGYSEVHETYERHAESLLESQEVPPGYRRYIRLYFERIRPR